MQQPLFECVPNISEGRRPEIVNAVADAVQSVPGVCLLDTTSDIDHHRSVLTFAGAAEPIAEAAFQAVAASTSLIDLNQHTGVHPRAGALDVLPFVPLAGATMREAVELAHATGQRIWDELRIPVYFYEAAALRPDRKRLEDVRRGGFEGLRDAALVDPTRAPDIGGPALHGSAGAVLVGARKVLIAFNVNLQSTDITLAKAIAARIRERNGGLPGIKALGLALPARGQVQVSMNITDYERTSPAEVFRAIAQLATDSGVAIAESELIGLLPRAALEGVDPGELKLHGFTQERFIEDRIEQRCPRAAESPL